MQYFFTFGQGSRTCIGKNVAMLGIQKLVPTLVRRFEFEFAAGGEWKTENRFLVKQFGFLANVKGRKLLA